MSPLSSLQVRLLVEGGAELGALDEGQRSALSWAAGEGHEAGVLALLQARGAADATAKPEHKGGEREGGSLDRLDQGGLAALHHAVKAGSLGCVSRGLLATPAPTLALTPTLAPAPTLALAPTLAWPSASPSPSQGARVAGEWRERAAAVGRRRAPRGASAAWGRPERGGGRAAVHGAGRRGGMVKVLLPSLAAPQLGSRVSSGRA